MKKKVAAVVAPKIEATGSELLRKMATEALNRVGRDDRRAARELMKEWARENDDMLEAIGGPAINVAITQALSNDIQKERRDVLARSRSMPTVGSVMAPRNACLPQPSPDAEARHEARVRDHLKNLTGLHELPIPIFDIPLGLAKPWQVKEVCRYYMNRMRGETARAHLFGFVWQACADKDKPEAEQRTVGEQVDVNTLRLLDERSRLRAENATLDLGAEKGDAA